MEQSHETLQASTPDPGQAFESSVVDDIISGGAEESVFDTPATNEGLDEPFYEQQPEMVPPSQPVQEEQASNDHVRARYWQSQHDKLKNEYNQMVADRKAPPEEPKAEEAPFEFPPAPMEPQRPLSYNQEDAMNDVSSESARYNQSLQNHQQDLMNYNVMKTEWTAQTMQNEREQFRQEIAAQKQADVDRQKEIARHREITGTLMREYGADPQTANEFITEMSNPNPTMQELWALFQMKRGGQPQQQQMPPQMQQMRHAQRSTPPLGGMPGQENQQRMRPAEDVLMDKMINDYNGKNPF
jgi:hypothetical protein